MPDSPLQPSESVCSNVHLPSAHDVREELERVVASSEFDRSPQLSNFLRYVVEKSLAGDAEHIKERNVAVEALARQDFDPRLDSIVRVTANRLRRALRAYYQGDGEKNPVHISLPKGAYAPDFQAQSTTLVAANDDAGRETTSQPEIPAQPDPAVATRSRIAIVSAMVLLAALIAFGASMSGRDSHP